MLRRLGQVILVLPLMQLLPATVMAQTPELESLRRNLDILTGVLEEGLGVKAQPGLFGINLGQVTSVYLQKQGVMVEVRSPLANQRNSLNLNTLASTIQDMQFRAGDSAAVAPPAISSRPETLALATRQDTAVPGYQDLIERINSMDFSGLISMSLRQAAQSMRSLQELGELDESRQQQLRSQLDGLRSSLNSTEAEVRQLQISLQERVSDATAAVAQSQGDLAGSLEALASNMANLREQASAKAEELQAMLAAARQRRESQWQGEVASLESDLFGLLCDYGASLRDLPDNEYLTVILKGLGQDAGAQERQDLIHVVSKRDLLQCQSGAISVNELKSRAVSYSY